MYDNIKQKSMYVFLIVFFIGSFIFFFVTTKTTSKNKQTSDKDYFSNVHYKIYGKIHSYTYLGGVTYTLKLNIDSVHFYKNTLPKESDFIGLYSKKDNLAILNATFNLDSCYSKNETLPKAAIDVVIDSKMKTIRYLTESKSDVVELRIFDLYDNYLKDLESDEMIRW